MPETVLELIDVSKKFRRGEIYDSLRDLIPALTGRMFRRSTELAGEREFWALRDVSFGVTKGEAVGIIGSNGAGKSTILKLLSRVMTPTVGTMNVRGRLSALIEVGAGFHPDLTGRENVYLNAAILGMTKPEIRRRFDEIVEFSGLHDFIDTPVKRYSSGMYARLGFSVAAHVSPDILLVDEVLSVGDLAFQNRCLERMRSVRASGVTVIFVSHNLHAVAELCERSILLEKGRVVMDGETNDVARTYLERSQLGRDEDEKKDAHITNVTLRNEIGPSIKFVSGETAWLDVEFKANVALKNVCLGLEVRDGSFYRVAHTSTERLGHPTWSLEAGEVKRVTIEFQMHLAHGTFHLGVSVCREDLQRDYDLWLPCVTFYASSDKDVQGCVNLYPTVLSAETL